MTIDEAIGKASEQLNDMVEGAILDWSDALVRNGVGGEELAGIVNRYADQLEAWKQKTLADLRSWLGRDGETLQ